MKHRKGPFFVFLSTLSLCIVLAFIAFFCNETRSKFQKKSIPSPLLSYGETGKILRELGLIQPLENKSGIDGFYSNTVDFAERAARERKKWLLLEKYKKYAENAIFGYIEMRSEQADVPFAIFSKKNNKLVQRVTSKIRVDKIAYPFFLKVDQLDREPEIQVIFYNRKHPVTIKGMAFFQKGAHPLVYTDPVAFNSILQDGGGDTLKITSNGIEVPQFDTTQFLKGKLLFKRDKKEISQSELSSEQDHSEGLPPKAASFVERAIAEQKRILLPEKFKKHSDSGVFGYIEMRSEELAIPFSIVSKEGNMWVRHVRSTVKRGKSRYPFFLDIDDPEIEIQVIFHNKEHPVNINGFGFFKKAAQPLLYTEPIAFRSFIRDDEGEFLKVTSDGLQISPLDSSHFLDFRLPFKKKMMVGISNYHKKQGNSQVELVSKKDHPLLKKLKIPDEQLAAISKKKISVLSIDVEEEDLYSKQHGILTNFDEHGRQWERLSYARFFRDGRNVFSNFSGIRLQGGNPGRRKGLINFRLFFREEYGKSMIEGQKLFDGMAGDIKRLAVKQSEWENWPLNSPIAYDVSREMGALAPPTELILLYLNGKELGLYYIVPHLGEKQIKSMLPDDDYQYYRIRGAQHAADNHFIHESFWKNLTAVDSITEEYASQFFDLDNLSRQLFSFIANATGDFCQGIALKGESPGSKMFWYSWDMDHSYLDVPVEIKKIKIKDGERWEQRPSISNFLFDDGDRQKSKCMRLVLFRRLVNEDPEFREKMKHLFSSIMNHQLTEEFITELLDKYQRNLRAISYPGGDEYIAILRDFFNYRELFLIEQMQTHFPAEAPVVCEVSSDKYPIIIDGFTKNGPYEGTYFPGGTLTLGHKRDKDVRYWLINGKKIEQSEAVFSIEADKACQVQAVH